MYALSWEWFFKKLCFAMKCVKKKLNGRSILKNCRVVSGYDIEPHGYHLSYIFLPKTIPSLRLLKWRWCMMMKKRRYRSYHKNFQDNEIFRLKYNLDKCNHISIYSLLEGNSEQKINTETQAGFIETHRAR